MWFGEVALDAAAVGALLAHSHRVDGGVLSKGHALTLDGVQALRAAGHSTVLAARLGPADVGENEVARRVARAAAGTGVRWSRALTGRCNLHAVHRGVVDVDSARVDALNLYDARVTLGTAAPDRVVEAGELLATVKTIPFAVDRATVGACEALAAEPGPMLAVAPLRPLRVGLVLSQLGGARSLRDQRAVTAQRTRLQALGASLVEVVGCAHRRDAVAVALERALDTDLDLVLFLGASATVDTDDVFPWAVRAVGGTVDCVGMPVDPGNLLVVGRHGHRWVLGVPGCARSLKPSGFDRVLRRCVAGLPVTAHHIARMGVGGLLVESRSAAQAPRPATPEGDQSVGAIVLAAGRSTRMEGRHKLLEPIDGTPMVRRSVAALAAAGVDPIVVVTGHRATDVRAALAHLPCRFQHNPDPAAGLGDSLARGADAISGVDAVLVALADMPDVRADHVVALQAGWRASGASIVVPSVAGRRGHPVLFDAVHLSALRACRGDRGARALVQADPSRVHAVEVDDTGVLHDIDTLEQLEARRRRGSP